MNMIRQTNMKEIFSISIFLMLISCHCDCSKSFRSELWKNNPNFRYLLVDDLIASKKIEDSTSSNIIFLLGEPERKFESTFIYNLGIKHNGRLKDREPSWLVIEFNADEITKKYSVTQNRPF